MVLEGRLSYQGDGMTISTRAMLTQASVMKIHTDNIANFGIPGYQRKEPVLTSFVEYLGPNAVDQVTHTEIGRIRQSGKSMDFALDTKGYFQRVDASGKVELTRDGRTKLDKDGYLLSLDNKRILSAAGIPIRLNFIPQDLDKHIKVSTDGEINVYNPKSGKVHFVGKFGIAAQDGSPAKEVIIRQGHVEDSNVMLQQEFVGVMPLRRGFEANRQLFILQSDTLSRMIQELGRAQ